MQAAAAQGVIASAWLGVPDDLRAAVPPDWLAIAAIALSVIGLVGRVVSQGGGE